MSVLLISVLVAISVTSLHGEEATVTTILTSTADQANTKIISNNFVEKIKETLRRNNDDYAAGALIEDVKLADTRRRFNDSAPIIADTADALPEQLTPSIPSTTGFRSAMKDLFRKKKHDRHSSKTTHSKHSPHRDKNDNNSMIGDVKHQVHVDKWKRLLEKSKRLRAYTSSPQIVPSFPAEMGRARVSKGKAMKHLLMARSPPRATTTDEGDEVTTIPTKSSLPTRPSPRQLPRFVGFPFRKPPVVRVPPNADQLDMAPARGAYIHDMRLKGKFCHRHVLWPEGPKYDSKGNTILPAFNSSLYRGHKYFFQTNKPLFVLPRCCNCCKKSVLGCQ